MAGNSSPLRTPPESKEFGGGAFPAQIPKVVLRLSEGRRTNNADLTQARLQSHDRSQPALQFISATQAENIPKGITGKLP